MSGSGIGLIKASKSSAFKEGDVVSGFVPWSSFFVANAASLVRAALRTDCCPHTHRCSVTALHATASRGDAMSVRCQ